MSLAYKPSGPIPGYKPMGFYAGWAYMRGNRVNNTGDSTFPSLHPVKVLKNTLDPLIAADVPV